MVKGKLKKYRAMKKRKALHPYLPPTGRLEYKRFSRMLNCYKGVVLKPTIGTGGEGVVMVTRLGNGQYELHSKNRRVTVKGKKHAYRYFKTHQKLPGKQYLVQRKIDLITVKGRPVDFRVMVQRLPGGPWTVTALAGKLAARGFAITNMASKILTFKEAIHYSNSNLKDEQGDLLEEYLRNLAIETAIALEAVYLSHRRYGVDIAIDQLGRLWIIEANLYGSPAIFHALGDTEMLSAMDAMEKYQ
ncbi:hypothetical protein CR205_03490 [Alteribacter lacisalsi]|uniref:ATP-grasp domain-containing protein n=1 Tax=Alteribacter lacisalsi TaxID=2045244 RepID=A0A2W0HLC7_9BACI|nr:YheC/YheD family protein [Alteribacter lacisalsi]PYZ97669.1 hypothetical protein CR205_03490 [Alteribacter lacisalsi]